MYNSKDLKTVYHLIRQVFGSRSSFVVPFKSNDSCSLFKDHEGIKKRWSEHFTDLFSNPSVIGEYVIRNLPQNDIIHAMMENHAIDGIKKTIEGLNTGRVPGLDSIPVEILLQGGNKLAVHIHHLVSGI
ncbi:Hypothetical predicted protein [Octopus vulgaris]|uniref:Uncharacterized protein n=1 Tax=Octopus vulgaris TaxID=6645 RepID=A0AA36BCQ0_OCTVU|nr:Hypothetical predicted protein [Octopus vulgaris]